MAAVAFDPLGYAHDLEATGVSREQAEVHAKAMTNMFIHNFDALVTKDYLDTRFSEAEARTDLRFAEFETRIEASMDKRFDDMDKRFSDIDKRFSDIDKRFSGVDKRFSSVDKGFAEMNVQFAKIHTEQQWLKWLVVSGIAATFWPTVAELIAR